MDRRSVLVSAAALGLTLATARSRAVVAGPLANPDPDPIPGDGRVIELKAGAESADLAAAIAKAAAAGGLPIAVLGEVRMWDQVVTSENIHLIGANEDATIIAANTDLQMFEGQIQQENGGRCVVQNLKLRGHRKKDRFSRSAVFHFPAGADLTVQHVDGRDIAGSAFQVREQTQRILIENSYFQDMFTFFKKRPGKQTLGYALALYGHAPTHELPLSAVPMAVFRNNTTRNCRHPVAVNNSGRLAYLDNVADNRKNNLNAAVIDAHGRQGDFWEHGARFLLAMRNEVWSPWFGAGLRGGQCWLGGNDFTRCGKNGAVGLSNDDTRRRGPIDRDAPFDVHVWDHKWHGRGNPVRLYGGVPKALLERVTYSEPEELSSVVAMIDKQVNDQLSALVA